VLRDPPADAGRRGGHAVLLGRQHVEQLPAAREQRIQPLAGAVE
jgi:hypothetical protein